MKNQLMTIIQYIHFQLRKFSENVLFAVHVLDVYFNVDVL